MTLHAPTTPAFLKRGPLGLRLRTLPPQTPGQARAWYRVLSACCAEPLTACAVAKRREIAPGTTTPILKQAAVVGLLEDGQQPRGRKASTYRLTTAGEAWLELWHERLHPS